MTNVIGQRAVDRVPWTTLVDDRTRSIMPENIKDMAVMDFYRHIGCDILQFGNFGFENSAEALKYPYEFISPNCLETIRYIDDDGNEVTTRKTKWGDLTGVTKKSHPIKYPVQSIEDVKVLLKLWEGAEFVFNESGCPEGYERMDRLLGDDGIFVPTTEPSPVQSLLEYEMGVENFYYTLIDHEDEMEELISVMNRVKLQEYRIIAEKMPHMACIPVENTSTSYISPNLYRKYCLPLMRDYADLMHRSKKKAIIHMCGLLTHLLPELKEVGIDGIHALTPKPVGDVDFDHVLDVLGDELIIIGCLDSSVFQHPNATSEDIEKLLDRTVTPRLRRSNYVLWAVADGLPTPVEKFLVINEWFEKNA